MRILILIILLSSHHLYSISPSENNVINIVSGLNYSQNYSKFRSVLGINTSQRIFTGLNASFTGTSSASSVFDAQFQFLYYIPISSNTNGINYEYYGHSFGFGIWGFDIFNKQKNIDLLIIPGVNWGTNKVNAINDITSSKYRNRFFSPKIKMEFRISYKSLAISIGADYQIDTSRKNWDHKEGEDSFLFPNPKSHTILPYFSLGYRFKK
jgi:hypothetical protein